MSAWALVVALSRGTAVACPGQRMNIMGRFSLWLTMDSM